MIKKFQQAAKILQRDGTGRLVDSIGEFLFRQYDRQIRYRGALPETYSLRYVDPRDIEYLLSPNFDHELASDTTHIIGGDWDQNKSDETLMFYGPYESDTDQRRLVPVDNYGFYCSVENHLRRGIPWSETEFLRYLESTDDLPDGSLYASATTREWRLDQIDRLAASMREEGYKTQRECGGEATVVSRDEHAGRTEQPEVPPEHHEVMIDIGRDGELIFEEGRHRFAAARALGIEQIPTRVFVRHTEWQQKRSVVANASGPEELDEETRQLLSHPDMTDVGVFEE